MKFGVALKVIFNVDPEVKKMQVKEVMTTDPACCTSDTGLREVAQMMVNNDCGEIPVVENLETKMPIGVITDRDIVCRTVARGLDPLELTVAECMTKPCVTVTPDMSLEECSRIMEQNQIRRVPVVDAAGACCGIVALADIARHANKTVAGEVVKEVSEPTAAASASGQPGR
jgi:CBS domain-containing protein